MSGILTRMRLTVVDEAARSKHGLDFSAHFNYVFRQYSIKFFAMKDIFTWNRNICIGIYLIRWVVYGFEAQKRARTVATAKTRDAASY